MQYVKLRLHAMKNSVKQEGAGDERTYQIVSIFSEPRRLLSAVTPAELHAEK